ncbi:hypothetical protein HX805_15945 [Pseudomonas sp. G5001]|uniref:hypothetical protein n=1 Tax=Pseudomonas sp. G5001 TaxID=2738824 RepID=UPI0015A405B0|nr:hypothetical protein [Pseudomonas sp. G5001]NWB73951.1 hypothetical protein [Pseudomonas sp. G5001]
MPEIKERPILFSAPMVRAILEGRKTVTRRALNVQALKNIGYGVQLGECHELPSEGPLHPNSIGYYTDFCPFGQPGDRLWVRETFGLQVRQYGGGAGEHIVYRATNPDAIYCKSAEGQEYPVKWKPSIHMPRHSSRILLEITDVRVERLQDISEEQAVAEGLIWQGQENGKTFYSHAERKYPPGAHQQFGISGVDAVSAFRNLWNSVGGDWDANPWVWVVEFKRVTP